MVSGLVLSWAVKALFTELPHSLILARIHIARLSMSSSFLAVAHRLTVQRGQFGIQYLAQGCFSMWSGASRNRTTNLPIDRLTHSAPFPKFVCENGLKCYSVFWQNCFWVLGLCITDRTKCQAGAQALRFLLLMHVYFHYTCVVGLW